AQQFNLTSYRAMTMVIISLESSAGMWINAFIVCVLCMGLFRNKTLNSNEKFLLFLGCSRFSYLFIAWVYFFLTIIYPKYLSIHPILQLLVSLQYLFNSSDLFVSACLYVFYCVKIANFRNSCFIYLKVKIDRTVPWLLLGSVLFSLVISILTYDVIGKALCKDLNSTCKGCIWKANIRIEEHFFPVFIVAALLSVTSFMTVIISALLLLFSLWRHKRHMQTNSMNDLSMDAHIRAMKSILSFFILCGMNFVFLILILIYSMMNRSHAFIPIYVFLYAFPGFHSLILIFSNPKFEKTMLRILQCVKCKVCRR
ncbi:T2R40 protein, partial [Pitta sordida]|nr:T2R40 protein [Pitta sordida]